MIDRGKKTVLGVGIDAVDYGGAVARILAAAHTHKAMAVSALAVHGVMTAVLDPTHRYRLNHFDLIVPDGQPVRWALNWLYNTQLADRVYGPTLMLQLCEQASQEGLPIYLYGSRPETIATLSQALDTLFPALSLAGAQPSRFRQVSAEEKQKIIADIRNSGAAMTFVGLGCPRQEVWAYEYHRALEMPVIAVGAAFDFHAGTLPQAPEALQRLGLEWFYRLVHEPRRLWKRYLFLNPLYLVLLCLQKANLLKIDPAQGVPPTQEIGYG